ncbi:MAG: ParA family protein [candidate division NC10 bacterium]|nr:ParA family protein [candidate division NC10 bacterium]
MARVISFINFKGGVGKTTCTVEIAVCLAAHHKKRVLLVDLDPQTNATFYLVDQPFWLDWVRERGSLKDLFTDYILQRQTFRLDRAIIPNVAPGGLAIEGLHLLPSHLSLITIDEQLAGVSGADRGIFGPQAILKAHLADFEDAYDFILCDCPPNFNLVTQNGFFASQAYLVPTLPDYLSTLGIDLIRRQASRFATGIRQTFPTVGAAYDEPRLLGIVLNRVRVLESGSPPRLPHVQQRAIQSLKNTLGADHLLFASYVTESVAVSDAPSGKLPVSISPDAKCRKSQEQFRRITDELLTRLQGG